MRLVKKESFLDIGCAEGLYAEYAVIFGFKLVVGLDISKIKLSRAVQRAKSLGIEINYVLGSAEYLPFRNDVFDLTLLSRVLECVPNEAQCLNEVKRVTKKYFILTVPSAHSTLFLLPRVLKHKQIIFAYPWRVKARLYYLNDLVLKLCNEWKIEEAFGIAPFSHLIVPISYHISYHSHLDDILEGKPLFRFLGHKIFLLCSKVK